MLESRDSLALNALLKCAKVAKMENACPVLFFKFSQNVWIFFCEKAKHV